MFSFLDKLIPRLFYLLFFLTPLILWPFSSELFEFNKMVFVYLVTIIIASSWVIKSLLSEKFIFRRTILDFPIIIFLLALSLSTFFSIDVRTSLLGYYSRFHGGLFSYLSYSVLYWAFVSNMDRNRTKKSFLVLVLSLIPVLIFGILEHFGIDKDIWVQDVQNRIFSSLGQPNWLAAWVVGLTPVVWVFTLKEDKKTKNGRFLIWLGISILCFIGLLFTKSRSGLLGLVVADLVFWLGIFWQVKRKALGAFIIHHLTFLALIILIGTPFASSVPAPETGGTESGEIRKIVWKGTVDLWKKYPVFGTGPETFAYSYYETRPIEHNLVSEWNFLYNKAHNEYLNFAATTGTVGLTTYLILIGAIVFQIIPKKKGAHLDFFWRWGLLSGFVSILVTNFFGFSVVPVALLFFFFPAFATTLEKEDPVKFAQGKSLSPYLKAIIFIILTIGFFGLFRVFVYWYADTLFAKGKSYNSSQKFLDGRGVLSKAVALSPKEPVYWDELSKSSAALAVLLHESGEKEKSAQLADYALSESDQAIRLSPRNLNLQRTKVSILERLAVIEPSYLLAKLEATNSIIPFAPSDASLYYGLGLTQERLGQRQEALRSLDTAIQMKSNYRNARFAKALILIEMGKKKEAKEELVYILEKIDPNDNLVRDELEKIN